MKKEWMIGYNIKDGQEWGSINNIVGERAEESLGKKKVTHERSGIIKLKK